MGEFMKFTNENPHTYVSSPDILVPQQFCDLF